MLSCSCSFSWVWCWIWRSLLRRLWIQGFCGCRIGRRCRLTCCCCLSPRYLILSSTRRGDKSHNSTSKRNTFQWSSKETGRGDWEEKVRRRVILWINPFCFAPFCKTCSWSICIQSVWCCYCARLRLQDQENEWPILIRGGFGAFGRFQGTLFTS